jgi:hypothetical protein
MEKFIIYGEWVGIWKRTAMEYFKFFSGIYLERLGKYTKTVRRTSDKPREIRTVDFPNTGL